MCVCVSIKTFPPTLEHLPNWSFSFHVVGKKRPDVELQLILTVQLIMSLLQCSKCWTKLGPNDDNMKSQGITMVIRIHPLGATNVYPQRWTDSTMPPVQLKTHHCKTITRLLVVEYWCCLIFKFFCLFNRHTNEWHGCSWVKYFLKLQNRYITINCFIIQCASDTYQNWQIHH